jgi:hypothetical protein
MADSDTRLFVSLIFFWTFLTIFSGMFANYLEEPIGTNINNFVPSPDLSINEENSGITKFMLGIYNFLSEIPVINSFIPLVKILTFGYSDKIPPVVTIFLQATLIFTYYVVWVTFKK